MAPPPTEGTLGCVGKDLQPQRAIGGRHAVRGEDQLRPVGVGDGAGQGGAQLGVERRVGQHLCHRPRPARAGAEPDHPLHRREVDGAVGLGRDRVLDGVGAQVLRVDGAGARHGRGGAAVDAPHRQRGVDGLHHEGRAPPGGHRHGVLAGVGERGPHRRRGLREVDAAVARARAEVHHRAIMGVEPAHVACGGLAPGEPPQAGWVQRRSGGRGRASPLARQQHRQRYRRDDRRAPPLACAHVDSRRASAACRPDGR